MRRDVRSVLAAGVAGVGLLTLGVVASAHNQGKPADRTYHKYAWAAGNLITEYQWKHKNQYFREYCIVYMWDGCVKTATDYKWLECDTINGEKVWSPTAPSGMDCGYSHTEEDVNGIKWTFTSAGHTTVKTGGTREKCSMKGRWNNMAAPQASPTGWRTGPPGHSNRCGEWTVSATHTHPAATSTTSSGTTTSGVTTTSSGPTTTGSTTTTTGSTTTTTTVPATPTTTLPPGWSDPCDYDLELGKVYGTVGLPYSGIQLPIHYGSGGATWLQWHKSPPPGMSTAREGGSVYLRGTPSQVGTWTGFLHSGYPGARYLNCSVKVSAAPNFSVCTQTVPKAEADRVARALWWQTDIEAATAPHNAPTTGGGKSYRLVSGDGKRYAYRGAPRVWPRWQGSLDVVDTGGCVWVAYRVATRVEELRLWDTGGLAAAKLVRPGLASWWTSLSGPDQSEIEQEAGAAWSGGTACDLDDIPQTDCVWAAPHPAVYQWSQRVYYEWKEDSTKRSSLLVGSGVDWFGLLDGESVGG